MSAKLFKDRKRIVFYVDAEEKKRLEAIAEKCGQPLSDFCRAKFEHIGDVTAAVQGEHKERG